MSFVLSMRDFVNDYLNLVMIMLGVISISAMLLILAYNSKSNHRLERDRMKKLQQDKLLAQELETQFANAINLNQDDVIDEDVLQAKEENVLKNIANKNSKEKNADIVTIREDGYVADFPTINDDDAERKQKQAEVIPFEELLQQADAVSDNEIEELGEEPKEQSEHKENKKIEEEIEEEPIKEEQTIKAEEKEEEPIREEVQDDLEQNNVLDNYENVIKESDAMLEAMQNIIDTNIEEMQKLEEEPLVAEASSKKTTKSKSLVSKYKVLYDKVKKEWVVKKDGATRATKRCKTKDEAIVFAKKCTIDAEIGNTFHQKDGKFQKRAKK